jgi:hypothetical protein
MSRNEPPGRELELSDLSVEPRDRHEALVDLFGQYVMWVRNRALESARKLVESEEARNGLGTIRRKPYDGVAAMPPEWRDSALRFSEATINEFIADFLSVLAHRGIDFRLGAAHAVQYKLEMEVVVTEDREVAHSEILNRDGAKHFADYWGRWLNRYRH